MLKVEAYERFKNRLFSGELKPGQFVTQRELADLVGVPLGPAREAIQRLQFESLVKVYPQRGIQITDLSARLIREAYQLRTVLETGAVRRFARDGDPAVMERLIEDTRSVLARSNRKITHALRIEAVEVDWSMHDAIIGSLGNELFSEAYRVNAARIRLIRANNVFSDVRLVEVMNEHLAILHACRGRKEAAAVSALEAHLGTSRDRALSGA